LKRNLYFLWIFITLYYILYTGCGTFLKEYVITHACGHTPFWGSCELVQFSPWMVFPLIDWCFNRKEEVVLTRCRIGHSRLTHSYLLNNEERPECIPCNSNYSLKHVLIDCVDVADVRQTFYNVNSLSNLFTNVAGDTILKYLKEINLYTKI
jgi:hypothetical protein